MSKEFVLKDNNGQDEVNIFINDSLGKAHISLSIWPKDENGNVTDMGKCQSISVSRYALIGLAYDILHSVERN